MRNLLTTVLLSFLLTAVASVGAAENVVEIRPDRVMGEAVGSFEQTKGRRTYEVVVYKVADLRSSAQTEDEFAVEVGTFLYRLTAINGVENCAQFFKAKDGSGFAARVLTIGAQAACPKIHYSMGDDYVATGLDIHSHIHKSVYNPTALDNVFLAGSYGVTAEVSTTPAYFSEGDYESPGYMASRTDVKFQSGHSNVRRVGKLLKDSLGGLVVTQSWSGDAQRIVADTLPSRATATASR